MDVAYFRIEPGIGYSEAKRLLDKPPGFFYAKRTLLKLECLYVPVYIFELQTTDKSGREVIHEVCVDAVEGQFAHIRTANLVKKSADDYATADFLLPVEEAAACARSEFRSYIHRLRPGLRIAEAKLTAKAWYPYWIGYYSSKRGYAFDVIDGCSGKAQGVRMQPLFTRLVLNRGEVLRKKSA